MVITSTDVNAWYDMQDGSGTSVTDESGNGHTMTLSNTSWVGSGQTASFSDSLSFNGTTSYGQIPQAAWAGTAGAIFFIFKTSNSGINQYLVDNEMISPTVDQNIRILFNPSSNRYRIIVDNNAFNDGSSTRDTNLHTACLTWDSGDIDWYFDGSYVTGTSGTSIDVTPDDVGGIGEGFFDGVPGGTNLVGNFQQLIIFNKKLDSTEVGSLHNSGNGITYDSYLGASPTNVLFAYGGL